MYTIYYGTNNSAKLNHMQKLAESISPGTLIIRGINELGSIDHNIDESGKDPLENARIKAFHYYRQINKPVFSVDSGLFFENVEYEDQPGTFVRRINGKTSSDDEMLKFYSELARKYGGEITGYYKNAICVLINEETVIECDDDELNSGKFIIASEPHKKLVEGWPLDSLSKDIKSGKYFYDLDHKDTETNPTLGNRAERKFIAVLGGALGGSGKSGGA